MLHERPGGMPCVSARPRRTQVRGAGSGPAPCQGAPRCYQSVCCRAGARPTRGAGGDNTHPVQDRRSAAKGRPRSARTTGLTIRSSPVHGPSNMVSTMAAAVIEQP